MISRLPPLAIALGIAGLIPFLACAAMAVGHGTPAQTALMTLALTGYGAVILAFLGAVHWGFALAEPLPRALPARLSLGVLPALVGWVALLLDMVAQPAAGIAVLVAGFVGVTAFEAAGARSGLVPHRYMLLRWGLSAVVIALLVTVLVIRLVGGRVVF